MRPAAAMALAATLGVAACGGANDDRGHETTPVVLEAGQGPTTTVHAEVADSADERARGLKGRESLPADAGMIFLFDEPAVVQFVMEDTLIPLSIAFADAGGRIVAIEDMEPCAADPCPTYGPDQPVASALEVNSGAFGRWGIEVGDRLRVEAPEG